MANLLTRSFVHRKAASKLLVALDIVTVQGAVQTEYVRSVQKFNLHDAILDLSRLKFPTGGSKLL